MNNRKVTILTTDLYQGGVAESTRKLARLLSHKHCVHVIAYDSTPINVSVEAAGKVSRIGVPLAANFARTSFGRLMKRILRPFGMLYATLYMMWHILTCRPDVIISLMYIPNIVNIFSTRFFRGIRVIISERQDPRMDLVNAKLVSLIVRWLYKFADVVYVNSPGMVEAVKEFYHLPDDRIFLLNNFFFLDEIRERAAEPLPCEHERIFSGKVIITSGRLSAQKGQWHLIEAFSRIVRSNPDVNLVILGDGELRGYLIDLAECLGISDKVHFLGNVANPHMYVKRAQVFVFPSIWESFGNSLLEAMALGIPVISTSCKSGPGDIIDWGRCGIDIGQLPRFGEADESLDAKINNLAHTIDSLLNNDALWAEYSRKAWERSQEFNWSSADAIVDKMLIGAHV